jgi:hypothetical protein
MNMRQTCLRCNSTFDWVGINRLSSFTRKFTPQQAHSRGCVQQCSQQSPTTSACFMNMRQTCLKCYRTIDEVGISRLSSFACKFPPQEAHSRGRVKQY